MAKKFQSGNIQRNADDYSLIQFLEYQTFRQQFLNDTENTILNRDGIILTAKSTITSSINAIAIFGNTHDSCTIFYKATINKVRNGRSAALSIVNLFSPGGERVHQPDPYVTLQSIQSEGTVIHNGAGSSFFYSIWLKNKVIPGGWMLLSTDTLYVRPVKEQITRRGKIKKARYYYPSGLLLMKGEEVYAALEQNLFHNIIYINNQLPESDKIMIASYLFIIACYHS